MASTNRPDKFTLDAYSDANLKQLANNGVYSGFRNRLATPILGAKGIQVLNVNFVNSVLQLNDYSLTFWYAVGAAPRRLRCVRLHPASFVQYPGWTSFVKNKYFNDCDELVAALNIAANTGGDSATFNTSWEANTIQFAFDDATRRITISSPTGELLTPVAADDPAVLTILAANGIRMNDINNPGGAGPTPTAAFARVQPYQLGYSMNARLGFAMSYFATGLYWGASSARGNACASGQQSTGLIEADASPILLGCQNVNVYLDIATGSGLDSKNRKNLAANIPVEVGPLNVNSYTLSSVQAPLLSTPNEIYEIGVLLLDENGFEYPCPPNYNVQVAVAVIY
jgi:hypothetical protein